MIDIKTVLMLGIFVIMSNILNAQPESDSIIISDKVYKKDIAIDDLIKMIETPNDQKALLNEFKSNYSNNDRIIVSEFKDYYEITIDHPSSNGYTGGAECYRLDKKTGKTEMIWHEHPMEIPEIEEIKDE